MYSSPARFDSDISPSPSTAPGLSQCRSGGRPVRLADARLAELDHGVVTLPRYDRAALKPSVVHIGVGGFHRAHQAVYLDEIANRGISMSWGVTGVGLHNPEMGKALGSQNTLYTVLERSDEGDSARVIGVMNRYLFAPHCPAEVLSVLASEETRLVTLTITGSGYPAAGVVDPDDPDVRADVDDPRSPRTVWGYLVEALRRRREADCPPFTILSCDNVSGNGAAVRGAIVSTAKLRDPELAEWIECHGAFPSSMVDRITPETTDDARGVLAAQFNVADAWPVVTEPFCQWFVEDDFCNGRPPLDQVGVCFVDDVLPYEVMKSRLLNGAHSALGYLASLAGFRTTADAMANPTVRHYVAGYLREAAALIPDVPGVDLDDYCASLLRRFANERIADQLGRLCRRGSTKVPSYVLPSLRAALVGDRARGHLVLAVAGWLRYLRGVDCVGQPFEVQDVRAEELKALVLSRGTDPAPMMAASGLFSTMSRDKRLVSELRRALVLLERGPLEAAAMVRAESLTDRAAA